MNIYLQVLDDYDAMLNQTNIGANNNKFYVVQALTDGSKFYTYTRWGRVVSNRFANNQFLSIKLNIRVKSVAINCLAHFQRPIKLSVNSRVNSKTKPKITVSFSKILSYSNLKNIFRGHSC